MLPGTIGCQGCMTSHATFSPAACNTLCRVDVTHVQNGCRFAHLAGVTLGEQEVEDQLDACLEAVELDYLLARYNGTSACGPLAWAAQDCFLLSS